MAVGAAAVLVSAALPSGTTVPAGALPAPAISATAGAHADSSVASEAGSTASTASAGAHPRAAGSLVLVGGTLAEHPAILRRVMALGRAAAGPGAPPTVAVVTAATTPARTPSAAADPNRSNAMSDARYYRGLFVERGAEAFVVPVDTAVNWPTDPFRPANAEDPRLAARVADANIVFLAGGNQMDYVDTLERCPASAVPDRRRTPCPPTAVLAAIDEVLAAGGVVVGTSAGTTIQQGPSMVTGGTPYSAWRRGVFRGWFPGRDTAGVRPAGGFGFFDAGLLDTHTSDRGRQARLVALAAATGVRRAFGIDDTTALVVDRRTRTAEVVGAASVSVLRVAPSGRARWSLLTAGDRVDLDSLAVTPAGTVREGRGRGPRVATDIWSAAGADAPSAVLRRLGRALVASGADTARGTTLEARPRFTTVLRVTPRTTAWRTPKGQSFADVVLRVRDPRPPECRPAPDHGLG
jgi:cyanophycinase-like exopeptidase